MHQGNWTCSSCGGAITELPFEPRRTDGLLCRECHQKQKGGAKPQDKKPERQTFSGQWQCADCGQPITSLPFEPRDTSNLRCIDCFKKTKAA